MASSPRAPAISLISLSVAASAAVAARGKSGGLYDSFRNRAMFPIIDLRGNVIGFGGRVMGDAKGPKYLNSSDTPVLKRAATSSRSTLRRPPSGRGSSSARDIWT